MATPPFDTPSKHPRITIGDEDGKLSIRDLLDQFVGPYKTTAPALADRTLLVSDTGASLTKVLPLIEVRNSAVLTTSYVATSALDTSNANQVTFHIDFTLGSLTDALFKVQISDDQLTWRDLTISNSGTVSSDEYQAQLLTAVAKLVPSTASLTSYTYSTPVQARWCRGSIKGEGTVTSSLAYIAASVGVSV